MNHHNSIHKSRLADVAIVFTGGTISMVVDPSTGGPVPSLSGAQILEKVPGLQQIAKIKAQDFALLPGPHMVPARMLELSHFVASLLSKPSVDGVVITHGTDTLEETAYLLSLTLSSPKPVVLVGAMRNSSELSWDGPANLRSAVRVAADPAARGRGVMVVMADQILSAVDATKTHTEAVDTFQSRDFGALGFVDKDKVLFARRCDKSKGIRCSKLEERVEIVKVSAGSDGRLIDLCLADGIQGLVVEGLGRGNVTIAALSPIQRAIDAGVPIVITSRCPRGRVLDTYAYQGSGRQLRKIGAILGGMHSSHRARIKLMLLLGAGIKGKNLRPWFESL